MPSGNANAPQTTSLIRQYKDVTTDQTSSLPVNYWVSDVFSAAPYSSISMMSAWSTTTGSNPQYLLHESPDGENWYQMKIVKTQGAGAMPRNFYLQWGVLDTYIIGQTTPVGNEIIPVPPSNTGSQVRGSLMSFFRIFIYCSVTTNQGFSHINIFGHS